MKHFFVNNTSKILSLTSFLLIGAISYRIGINQKIGELDANISIVYPEEAAIKEATLEQSDYAEIKENTKNFGSIIASKSGKVYYTPNCTSANRIKEENRIYFQTEDEAKSLGLTLSKTCK